MSKNLLQDMVKIKKDSALGPVWTGPKAPKKAPKNQNKGGSRYGFWFVAIISLVFFLFALSYLFSKATVTVNSRIKDLVLNENLSASLDSDTEILPFDLVIISGEEDKAVQTTLKKDISQRAEGVVVIYNTFSSASQMLSIDTRLEGSNGKIYKTQTKTIVPGETTKGEPGSVEVKIYANETGEEYNSIPLDFKIFGFKGTPKYSKFYGRSKGPITGGLQGKFSVIPDSQKVSVINELKTALQAKLFKKATEQIPDGFILFKDGFFVNTKVNDIDFTSSKDDMLSVKLKGTFYGILFEEKKLTEKIVKNNIKEYDDSVVYIPNIRDLFFALPLEAGFSDFGNLKNISFSLSGPTKIVWKVDAGQLASDLLGKSKKNFNQILSQYPNINSASLSLRPIWARSFPDKIKNIKIIVNYPK